MKLADLTVKHKAVAGTGLAALAIGTGVCIWRRSVRHNRRLNRPYTIQSLDEGNTIEDPKGELAKVITWLQDTVVKPIDDRLPGHPFSQDFLVFPFTSMVLVIGNHSAGKSTFINNMLGLSAQETAVAPTDDGFTVLERHASNNDVEDGPTLLGCPENRPFKELQRFGQAFWGNLKRKRLVLRDGTRMPYGLQIIDTPGMIDMPTSPDGEGGGRGYNFLEVTRWFAKRADLILLLFDPERPGTTRETLDVLTKSLAGLNHKFLIILNKVDSVKNSIDFARAYGTLGWALSKVIPRKDLPLIYTMYNDGTHGGVKAVPGGADDMNRSELPLERFRQKREEVVTEVLRARERHWDNVLTSFEQTLRDTEMIATVSTKLQGEIWNWRLKMHSAGFAMFGLPGIFAAYFGYTTGFPIPKRALIAGSTFYAVIVFAGTMLVRDYMTASEAMMVDLDKYFESSYEEFFIHGDVEDLRGRWLNVKPKITNILRTVPTAARLSSFKEWEISKVREALNTDLDYLRQLARLLRQQDQAASPIPYNFKATS